MRARILTALLTIVIIQATAALAKWPADGTPVATGPGDQFAKAVISDGAGGFIVTWEADNPNHVDADIYAQRISASGMPLWTPGGVPICTAPNIQNVPAIASDGYGGAFIAWLDARSAPSIGVYVQRVDSSGTIVFQSDGLALCQSNGGAPVIANDGHRAVVAWAGHSSSPGAADTDIYTNLISASGYHLSGLDITPGNSDQLGPAIATRGAAGGAIITWRDLRNGGNNSDIYAQRVDPFGFPVWSADLPVCTAPNDQTEPAIVSDTIGGGIIVWQDFRNGADLDIYTQHVDSLAVNWWVPDGAAVCMATDDQESPRIVFDPNWGAIVCWTDARNGPGNADIYAQEMSWAGVQFWAPDGVPVCTAPGIQADADIITDGAGGAVVTWDDARSGDDDIYAQRLGPLGTATWTGDGVVVYSGPPYNQLWPLITSDGTTGGAIVTWADYRNGTDWDLYAQHVEGTSGSWGIPAPQLSLVADIPQDQGGKVKLNFLASDEDVIGARRITQYSMWRGSDALSPSQEVTMVGSPADVPAGFSGKAIWAEHRAAGDYYWEWIGSIPAHGLNGYTFTAETRADSTGQGSAEEYFFVSAQTADPYVFFDSNVMSGHSVDNLAPSAPLMLTAQRAGADVHLKWNGVHVHDLKDYAVYRATSSGVTPVPSNFLVNDTDTLLVDTGAPTSALYYIVTAYDVHQNQSKPSNEAQVSATTNVGNLPPITALTVLPNHPNPFNMETELEIGLPEAGAIRLEVYDVAGRRVRTMEIAGVKGWQKVAFSGFNNRGEPLASGVYFYRVKASGTTLTRKMLITR
jgi:hypothetical protein